MMFLAGRVRWIPKAWAGTGRHTKQSDFGIDPSQQITPDAAELALWSSMGKLGNQFCQGGAVR